MANHAQALKRNRQRIRRTARNRATRSSLRTDLKKARLAIENGEANTAEVVKAAQSALDKAATKGTIPANRANRVKARLASALHKASKAAA